MSKDVGLSLKYKKIPCYCRKTVLPGTTDTLIKNILKNTLAKSLEKILDYESEFLREGEALMIF